MTRYYKGKHIVKFVDSRKEIYVEFDEGQIWICEYENNVCVSRINVANLKMETEKEVGSLDEKDNSENSSC